MNDGMEATRNALAQFCGACGHKLQEGMKFCGGCGHTLTPIAATAGFDANNGFTSGDADAQAADPSLTLTQGWGCYGAGLALFALVAWLILPMAFITYLALGVFMSRFVMRRLVEWHPNYNTLHNVFSAKIGMVFLWPLRMLMLLVKLSANHVL